ncbi:MAG: LysR family transcriptional regulator [Labilithrix sp.]|nr:LysR family transcriptional regulator [Labilithrix sp.]
MNVPWEEVQLLLAIAEARSVTAAARRLQITQPTASRRLSQLESLLGERLFVRSVEGVALTPFAERMLEPARRMAEWAGEVDRAAARTESAPGGVVRITAPPGVAFELVAPFAAWLRGALPDVTLDVVSSVQYVDLVRREADLALRLSDSGGQKELVTIASLAHGVGVFGSPAYARSLPKSPRLTDIAWIGWAPPLEHLSPNPELAKLIPGFRPIFASDDFLVQLRAAEAGIGAVFLGRARHRFSASSLVELDVDFGNLKRSLHLVCAKRALDIPRVRAVADLLARELEQATEPPRAKRAPARRAARS